MMKAVDSTFTTEAPHRYRALGAASDTSVGVSCVRRIVLVFFSGYLRIESSQFGFASAVVGFLLFCWKGLPIPGLNVICVLSRSASEL